MRRSWTNRLERKAADSTRVSVYFIGWEVDCDSCGVVDQKPTLKEARAEQREHCNRHHNLSADPVERSET